MRKNEIQSSNTKSQNTHTMEDKQQSYKIELSEVSGEDGDTSGSVSFNAVSASFKSPPI